MMHMYKENQRC